MQENGIPLDLVDQDIPAGEFSVDLQILGLRPSAAGRGYLLRDKLCSQHVSVVNRRVTIARRDDKFDGSDSVGLPLTRRGNKSSACGNTVVGSNTFVIVADAHPDRTTGELVGQCLCIDPRGLFRFHSGKLTQRQRVRNGRDAHNRLHTRLSGGEVQRTESTSRRSAGGNFVRIGVSLGDQPIKHVAATRHKWLHEFFAVLHPMSPAGERRRLTFLRVAAMTRRIECHIQPTLLRELPPRFRIDRTLVHIIHACSKHKQRGRRRVRLLAEHAESCARLGLKDSHRRRISALRRHGTDDENDR